MKWRDKLSSRFGPEGNPFLRLSPADRNRYVVRTFVFMLVLMILNEARIWLWPSN